jgi:hypothetical protein
MVRIHFPGRKERLLPDGSGYVGWVRLRAGRTDEQPGWDKLFSPLIMTGCQLFFLAWRNPWGFESRLDRVVGRVAARNANPVQTIAILGRRISKMNFLEILADKIYGDCSN